MEKKTEETTGKRILRTEMKPLPCKLKDAEVLEVSRKLANKLAELRDLSLQEKSVKDSLKQKRSEMEEEVARLGMIVRQAEETRVVTVDLVADFEAGVALSIRNDTQEILGQRPLTPDERQEKLFREEQPEPEDGELEGATDGEH